ncbi:Integrase family protein [Candidatus Sulfobium mesophilum]|uniref:Integrase family protein n=1 Tax=Candidatus Sulfobium mesophilum TaxID=2016548 RepID=A0A2U3QJY7_9BACT|nr:Integrase family protein [Candidatus Sulfobium mesophilum]
MEYRKRTKHQGVYERLSETRTTHKGKPDVCYDISYKHEGRKIWEKVGWASEGYSAKLAADVRAERVRSIRHNEELPRDKKKVITFRELTTEYLKWAKANKKSWDTDEFRCNKHLLPRFGQKRLNEILPLDLERMKAELTKDGQAPASVKHALVLFRGMVNKAIEWRLFSGTNPVKAVKMPVVRNQRERFLNVDEANTLLAALRERSVDAHDMALISLQCGLRFGEIVSLTGRDVDIKGGTISVYDSKSGSRVAFMTDAVKEVIRQRLSDDPGAHLFIMRQGEPYKQVPEIYREVANKLFNVGVKDQRFKVGFHTLRHSFASMLVLQGVSLVALRDLLGHKSLQMVSRYSHLSETEKRQAVASLGRSFTQGGRQAQGAGNG